MRGSAGAADVVSVSVHGPAGVLDLLVPAAATARDVATEYARQSGGAVGPVLYSHAGAVLSAEASLADAGIESGSLLVAVPPTAGGWAAAAAETGGGHSGAGSRLEPGALSTLWLCLAAAAAVLAGLLAAVLAQAGAQAGGQSDVLRTATIGLLLGAAVLGVVPLGPLTRQRVLAAPAFAGAAAYAIAWAPADERLPTVIGVAALGSAIAAGVARALDREAEEGLRVWMVAGATVFVVPTLGALLDLRAQVVWSVLLVAAMLTSRFVPMLAVEVPDQYLLDVERLAVTAWSAREQPVGRRSRVMVPHGAVTEVASRGSRLVTAAAAAVLAVVAVSAPLLLTTTGAWLDHLGAQLVVGFAGGGLLLSARSYRHVGARGMLRLAGLLAWLVLVVDVADDLGDTALTLVTVGGVLLGALMVVISTALARGWRSAWWSRRAEVGEAICGSFAIGALVLAVGLFRAIWEV